MSDSPFHRGEQLAQERAGVHASAALLGQRMLQPQLAERQRTFLAQLPFVIAAATDRTGQPWASVLAGPPGFIRTPDDRHLQLATKLHAEDALSGALCPGARLGLLGIDLETRRRLRINGTLREASTVDLQLQIAQAYGNCPRYITPRSWRAVETAAERVQVSRHERLDAVARAWIGAADTLFLASGCAGEQEAKFGMDASHRGGSPGFVRMASDSRLIIPDYAGNNLFNTIGNLLTNPRIGLLFIDFETGSLLQITGTATIDWEPDRTRHDPDAQRLVVVDILAVTKLLHVLPLRWA